MDSDPLDDFIDREFARLGPLSDDEKAGALLGYFSSIIETMRREDLIEFRAHCLRRFPPGDEQTTILEVIDGQLALLSLNQN